MELNEILDWHLRHYPLLQADDIYKLIYQGVFGPGHLGTEIDVLRRQLNEELRQRSGCFAVEELEPVDPEGLLVRVNLGAVVGSPVRQERLIMALVRTGRDFVPEPELLGPRVASAVNWCQKNLPGQASALARRIRDKWGVPVHSEIYRRVYQPAYRVIFAHLWQP
jgi:hypothetical protein